MVVLILYQYDIKYVTKCNTKFKKCRKYGVWIELQELRFCWISKSLPLSCNLVDHYLTLIDHAIAYLCTKFENCGESL